jgi:hypothetical protein
MGLPTSRDETFTPLSPVASAFLNDLQDQIIAANLYPLDQAGKDAATLAAEAGYWTRGPALGYASMIASDGTHAAKAYYYVPTGGAGRVLGIGIQAYDPGAGALLKLYQEDPTGGGSLTLVQDLTSLLTASHTAWAYAEAALSSPLTMAGGIKPVLEVTANTAGSLATVVNLVRWKLAAV